MALGREGDKRVSWFTLPRPAHHSLAQEASTRTRTVQSSQQMLTCCAAVELDLARKNERIPAYPSRRNCTRRRAALARDAPQVPPGRESCCCLFSPERKTRCPLRWGAPQRSEPGPWATCSLRSTCGAQLTAPTRRTRSWRSTSAGTSRAMPGWSRRSRRRTCARAARPP